MDVKGIPADYILLIALLGIIFPPLLAYVLIAHVADYRIIKNYHLRKHKWGLNICCGNTDGGGINADIVKRDVRNFVLVKDIYNLPFRNKQFRNVVCSHTLEHVDSPDKFFRELRRISKKVVILVPPVWDLGSICHYKEHKHQFMTFKTRHINRLPAKARLPYSLYQDAFGQRIE